MASSIDLHIHTTASDGSDSPLELLEKLRQAGIRVFSVTDHDTVCGVLELEGRIPADMIFLTGVEFTCISPSGKCHILGYGMDPRHPELLEAIAEGRRLRLEKLQGRLENLRREHGIVLTGPELRWLNSLNSPGKPHLGQILVKRGLAPDLDSAIRGYIRDVPGRDRIEASTAIRAIEKAGGISVWAHPLGGEGDKPLTAEKFEAQLKTLLDDGIRGMECWYSRYTMDKVRFLEQRARMLGLIVTGGSDYHGTAKQNLDLGQLNTEGVAWEPEINRGCFT